MCFKFRTMFVGVEIFSVRHEGHLCHLMNSNAPIIEIDSRVKCAHHFSRLLLRWSGFDELPQLIDKERDEFS